jgi:FKBP-type peptidyl-prolyl cis-trans isomerase FkpA
MRRVMMGIGVALLLACGGGEQAASGGESSAGAAADQPASSGGLEITHLTEGAGASPQPTDTVEVHYHGTFPDGSVFDSSVDRGQPATFPLNRVIRCWTEGVVQMKVGGKVKLVCPPEIAYGARGAPPRIPANATLHFEVELLGIK